MQAPQLDITQTEDMTGAVISNAPSDPYADERNIIRDGSPALPERTRAIEHWLHAEVGPAWDALKADPARALTAAQVRARLAAEHARTQ